MPVQLASISKRFSANLDSWRCALIVLVVINHVLLMTAEVEAAAWERALIVLTRAGVPALSLFSGYLLASQDGLGRRILVGRKLRSLIVPFLIWNSLGFVLLLGLNEVLQLDPGELVANQSHYDLVNNLTAFHGAPANYPLYFLRDLFISFLGIILLRPVLRHPAAFAIAMAALVFNYATDIDGRLVIRNTIPLFLLAGFGLRRYPAGIEFCRRARLPLAALALLLLPVWALTDMKPDVPSLLDLATLSVFTALVVGLAAALPPVPRLARWGRDYAFITFLSHAWVLLALDALWAREAWGDEMFWMIGMPSALLVGVLLARLIRHLPHPIGAALAGGRIGRAGTPRPLPCGRVAGSPTA